MSRRFTFMSADEIGDEIEQYIYGKYGTTPPKALLQIVIAAMSKNPLTQQQKARIVREYGDKAFLPPEGLSVSAETTLHGGIDT